MNRAKAEDTIRPWQVHIGFMSSVRTSSIGLFEIGLTPCGTKDHDDLFSHLYSYFFLYHGIKNSSLYFCGKKELVRFTWNIVSCLVVLLDEKYI